MPRRTTRPMHPGLEERRNFGRNVRRARQAVGLTQRDVAGLTGLTQKWVSEIEQGHANVAIETMSALATALGVSVHRLTRPT